MTSVRQKIPNFIGGISQQPDEKIPPGTVKDALNATPDVKGILSKRPGSELIGTLSDHIDGKWHCYFRDNDEQYFMRIRRDGQVDVWDALTGTPRTVLYNSDPYSLALDRNLTNKELTDGSDDAYPSCSSVDVAEKTVALQKATLALRENKIKLEQLEITKKTLEAKGAQEYFTYSGTTVTVGSYRDPSGQNLNPFSDGWIDKGKPDNNATRVFRQRGRVSYQYCFNNIFDTSNDGYCETRTKEVDLYAWRVEDTASQQQLEEVNAEIAALNALTPGLLDDYMDKLAFYEASAARCGIFENPFSRATKTTETVNAPDYLKWDELNDPTDPDSGYKYDDSVLQLITVNDYTFITNRSKLVTMNSGVVPPPVYEAFIELKQLEYNKPYVIRLYGEEPVNNQYERATKLSVSPGSFMSADGSCPGTGFAEGTKEGVQYRLTVEGYPVLEANPDRGDAYDCQYRVSVDLLSSEPKTNGTYKGVSFTETVGGRTYTITVTESSTSSTTAESVISVPAISTDEVLDAAALLTELADRIDAGTTGFDARVIGNGVYVVGARPFTVDTPDTLLFECINKEVNNVALLPTQCKDGFIVKVVNSFVDEDDYYVKFVSTIPDTDGAGVWEETYKPGIKTKFDFNSMPHQIRRLADGRFEVSPIKYDDREVGDEITNPEPSFVNSYINKILFFRDRFAFLSGENVIMSRPNEYFNYWVNTALVVSDADPIDLRCSSTTPAILYDGIESSAGLVLFSANQQFLLMTDNTDVFSPLTANIKSIGTYKYNTNVKPVHMGQTIGFLNDAGYRSRFFELVPSRDYDYEAIETSKPVDQLISSGINIIATSKDNNMLALAVKGTDEVFIYRFFNEGEKRVQSAWVRWKLSSPILFLCVMKDKLYAVLDVETGNDTTPNIVTLQSFDLKINKGSLLVTVKGDDMLDYDYQVHLDNYFMVTPAEMVWNRDAKSTTFRLPIGFHGPKPIAIYELALSTNDSLGYVTTGRYAEATGVGAPMGVLVTVPGDWRNNNIMCGYNFDFEVLFPKLYVTKKDGEAFNTDTEGSLVIHRAQINFEATGYHTITVDRKGREPYTVEYESTIQDGYLANKPAIEPDSMRILPVYDRNTNVNIRLESTHPTPANIISMSWEGDYNPNYYKSV